jgi:hypothetical protein
MLFKRRLHKPLLFNLMPIEKPILMWHSRINNAGAARLFAISSRSRSPSYFLD